MPRRDGPQDHSGKPRFVVHEHQAQSTHYDFWLEADGILKSWAVPQGPPTDPSEKVLATPTEDHPLEYEHFQGVTPPDQPDAGPVALWDTGTYRNITDDHGEPVPVAEAIRRGHLAVRLEGKKMRGDYSLTRMRRRGTAGWLLVKMRDEAAGTGPDPRRDRPESVRVRHAVKHPTRAD
jgi:DNA ligase D-like protein (predicted 3'-phosphoesterase)